MYTQDLLQIIGNPRYNPISDPAYDIEKYSKLCAGIMFLCEGEVLMLQRNSNNNDRTFDFPGGTIDNEDFDQYYNSLMTHREYKKKLKSARNDMKYGLQGAAHAVADHMIDRFDTVTDKVSNFTDPQQPENQVIVVDGDKNGPLLKPVEQQGPNVQNAQNQNVPNEQIVQNVQNNVDPALINHPIDHDKRPIYPQVPLYDSFYYADIFSSQFQTLGLNSWQQQGHMKRKQLETLYEQATRHYKHGFGFDSSPWTAAVRETQEELNFFPKTISPIAVFNLYRGWTDIDEDSESDSSSDDSDSDIEVGVDPESKRLLTGKELKQQNGKNLNINASLMGNGKLIGDNFRRYSLYVCSITPEERNILSANIKLSEEHSEFAWMPLTLLIPMHSTHVSVFKHFRLHPWVIAFIEQYSSQFDKLSRKTFWVGYNRHFEERYPTITDQNIDDAMKAEKGKKKNKDKKKKKNKGGDQDVDATATAELTEAQILERSQLSPGADKEAQLGANVQDILNLEEPKPETNGTNSSEQDEDEEDDTIDADGKKKKKGGKKKKDKKKKGDTNEDEIAIEIDPSAQIKTGNDASEESEDNGKDQGFTQAYYDETAVPVEYCDRDIFITVFLPLVKKYINPKVYL